MSTISEVIIWISPLIAAVALWLFHELYNALKVDINDIKSKQNKTRDDVADLKSDIRLAYSKIENVDKSVNMLITITKVIDEKTGNTKEMTESFRDVQSKISAYNSNYGKVILILQRLVDQKKNPPPS